MLSLYRIINQLMKEVTFIRRHLNKWKDYEIVVESPHISSPDEMADAYINVTSDLAFAQTHYPHSRITTYLNNLASAIHQIIYRNKREPWSRLITFWTHEVPLTIWDARGELRTSLVIFLLSTLVGCISQMIDPDFARIILGDQYVDMTLQNIENGHPTAVYDSSPEGLMFIGITTNNIKVSFMAFASGLLTSFCTGFVLLQNGIMLGSFQTFFYQHHLLWDSALAIWLHGTIEISSIIVAGAAGIAIGNGWLFPGTYSRMHAFRRGAKRGMKIVVGTVPLFITAGFIESFLTRHAEWPDALRLTIILLSAALIIFYFIILPYFKHLKYVQNNGNA